MEFDISFGLRAHAYSEDEISQIVALMREKGPLTQNRHLSEFEMKFRQFAGVDHAFAVNSATSGLEIVAQLAQVGPGDEIIVPAHTYTSSAYPFAKTGASIVWCDIDPDTRVASPDTIAECLSEKSRAVVVPHLYGFGADMPGIMSLARDNNLIVIEDAAQAAGVRIDDRMVGTFGDFGIYSFHSHKNVTTFGEGGMVVVRDQEIAQKVPMLRHNGHQAYPPNRRDYWIPAMTDVVLPDLHGRPMWPINACLNEASCALGTRLLDRVEQINNEKRIRALKVIDELADFRELSFHRESSRRHNYYLLAAECEPGLRDRFIRRMAEHHRIQCVVQYFPLNRYPFYSKLGFSDARVPNTDHFFDNMVSFPFSHLLTDVEIDIVVTAAKETLEHFRGTS